MNNNINVNLNLFNNNYIVEDYDASMFNRPPREIVVTRRVGVLDTDSAILIAFKRYLNQCHVSVYRTTGKKNRSATPCPTCNIESSPQWRPGPDDLQLCNACGLQFAKFKREIQEQKRIREIEEQEKTREKMSLSYILN